MSDLAVSTALKYLCDVAEGLAGDPKEDEESQRLSMVLQVVRAHIKVLETEPVVDRDDIIKLVAQVYKPQVLSDGGMRFSLDTGEDAIPLLGRLGLLACRGTLVAVALSALGGPRIKPSRKLTGGKHGT